MDSYTITIAPNDGSGNTTTLVVDTSGPQIRITDVNLHAANGLTGGQMPTVDFGLLLRAVANPAPTATPIAATTDEPAPVRAAAAAAAPTPTQVAEATAASEANPAPAATRRPRRAARATAADRASEQAPRRGTRGARAAANPKIAPPKAAKRASGATTATAQKPAAQKPHAGKTAVKETTSARVYRRMPDDLAAVYQQAGTPAAIAEHYAVPRHTAQGWIRRAKTNNAASTAG